MPKKLISQSGIDLFYKPLDRMHVLALCYVLNSWSSKAYNPTSELLPMNGLQTSETPTASHESGQMSVAMHDQHYSYPSP